MTLLKATFAAYVGNASDLIVQKMLYWPIFQVNACKPNERKWKDWWLPNIDIYSVHRYRSRVWSQR